MRIARMAVIVGALLVPTSKAFAATFTVDYSNATPGVHSSSLTVSGLTADGISVTVLSSGPIPTFTAGTVVSQNLFVRDESPGDLGLGVCSEGASCGTGSGDGDFNEISNQNVQELIRLTLPGATFWESLSLSSLDTNNGTGAERGQLFGGSSPDPASAVWLMNFTGTGDGALSNQGPINLLPFQYTYLFVTAWDHTGGNATNNDFLLKEVVFSDVGKGGDNPVPEPATLTLLGLGLAAGAVRRRLHRKN